MFKSISWHEFLIGVGAVLGSYYVLSFLLLYSRDAYYWLTRKGNPADHIDVSVNHASRQVMGPVKQGHPKVNESSAEAEDLIIIVPDNKENRESDSLLIGSVSDLLHEIKVLAGVINESSGSKEEDIPMFQSLLSNYPQLVGTKYQDSITLFVHQHFSNENLFEVSLDEIKSWWPVQESQNNLNNKEDEK